MPVTFVCRRHARADVTASETHAPHAPATRSATNGGGTGALPDFDTGQWQAMLTPVPRAVFAPAPPAPRKQPDQRAALETRLQVAEAERLRRQLVPLQPGDKEAQMRPEPGKAAAYSWPPCPATPAITRPSAPSGIVVTLPPSELRVLVGRRSYH